MKCSVRLVVRSDADFDQLSWLFYEEFDGLIAQSHGRLVLQVDVSTDAAAYADLLQTIEEVERVLPVEVWEVDLDLVDIPEIASRVGRSRQSVQQLVTGRRGPGGFPPPVGVPGGIRIWDWASVARWLADAGVSDVEDVGASRSEAAKVNAWLAVRREAPEKVAEPGHTQAPSAEAAAGRRQRALPKLLDQLDDERGPLDGTEDEAAIQRFMHLLGGPTG